MHINSDNDKVLVDGRRGILLRRVEYLDNVLSLRNISNVHVCNFNFVVFNGLRSKLRATATVLKYIWVTQHWENNKELDYRG